MGRQAHLNPLPGATRFHSKCLRARLWDPVGPRRPWAGSGVSSGPPPPSPHLWPDTSIQPLLGHRRLPQGPGPSPILPVESCLVASLERFHTRDPNPHRRRKPAGAPSRGAGEGARPTAGPRQVIQPGSPGLRPSWCGGAGPGRRSCRGSDGAPAAERAGCSGGFLRGWNPRYPAHSPLRGEDSLPPALESSPGAPGSWVPGIRELM